MGWILFAVGCWCALWVNNVIWITKAWLRDHGVVTLGDLIFFTFIGFVVPVGMLVVAIEYTKPITVFRREVFSRRKDRP